MDVAVIVATFGELRWAELAQRRAKVSAELEEPADLVVFHGGSSIAEARNTAAAMTSTEWLCFLDADDELEPGYLRAMAARQLDRGLLAPAIREVVEGIPGPARVLDDRNMATLNPCVVGTLIRREIFDLAGGFWTERAWEDWSLFRRAWLLGEEVHHVADAVYRVHVNPSGRNGTVLRPRQLHRDIVRSHALWKRDRQRRPR
jgi:glycosyltransferase involved in cell wall biosynthesis